MNLFLEDVENDDRISENIIYSGISEDPIYNAVSEIPVYKVNNQYRFQNSRAVRVTRAQTERSKFH